MLQSVYRTQEKYLRMRACENILLEIPDVSNLSIFKKIMSSLSENNREFGFHIAGYVAEEIKS